MQRLKTITNTVNRLYSIYRDRRLHFERTLNTLTEDQDWRK